MYSKVLIVCFNEDVKKEFIPAFEEACESPPLGEYITVEDFEKRSERLQPTIPTKNVFSSIVDSFGLFTQKKIEGIELDVRHIIHSFNQPLNALNLFNGKEDSFISAIDLCVLVLDETALADPEALKSYLTAISQQSPKAKFQIVFYKNAGMPVNKLDYDDPICTKINQLFSSLNFEEKKWNPRDKGFLRNFFHFGYGGAALDVFNALQEPFYQALQAGLEALEKEKISYKVSQFFEELGQKISEKIASLRRNVTIFGSEKTNELVKKVPIAVEEKTNIQDSIPSKNSIITEENKREIVSSNNKKQDEEGKNNFITPVFHAEKKSDAKPQKEKLTAKQVLAKLMLVGQNTSLSLAQKQEQAIALVRDNIDQFSQDDIYEFIPLTISKEFEKGEPAYRFITSPNTDPYADEWFAWRARISVRNEIYFNKVKEKNGSFVCHYKVISRIGGTGSANFISIDQNTTDEELKSKIIEHAKENRYLFSAQDCAPYFFIREKEKGVFYNMFGRYTDTNAWNTINELLWQRLQALENYTFKPSMFSGR